MDYNATAEMLRGKHIKTLEAMSSIVKENKELKKRFANLTDGKLKQFRVKEVRSKKYIIFIINAFNYPFFTCS